MSRHSPSDERPPYINEWESPNVKKKTQQLQMARTIRRTELWFVVLSVG